VLQEAETWLAVNDHPNLARYIPFYCFYFLYVLKRFENYRDFVKK
jgi:hypothetical protein